jgi:hypothetical protein
MSEPLEKKPKETKSHEAFLFTYPKEKVEKILKLYWSRIDVKGTDDCWNWTYPCTSEGYGVQSVDHFTMPRTHRLAWTIKYNTLIPKGLFVCHSCDNPLCCNPEHLFLGNFKINMKDLQLKKRNSGKWINFKTSTNQKKQIIIEKLSTNFSFAVIAKRCNLPKSTVKTLTYIFFSKIKDRSFLPEPLKSRYSHCRNWAEAKELKKKYDEQDRKADNNTIQSTNPL